MKSNGCYDIRFKFVNIYICFQTVCGTFMLVLGGVLAQTFTVLDGNSLQSYCENSSGLML
jgi:hypothetical protein